VLAECPTHLGLTPMEAESWVREKMTPVFPLGVKKDLVVEPREVPARPSFEVDTLVTAIEATTEKAPKFATGFPVHIDPSDVALKLHALEERYAAEGGTISHLDGISVDFDDWHFNVRPSNTEPLLRLNLEARSQDVMEAKRDEVLSLIRS